MSQPCVSILNEWYDFMEKEFDLTPNLIVYLQTDPNELMSRIVERGRGAEQ